MLISFVPLTNCMTASALDETNFENLVRFYSEELLKIEQGIEVTEVISGRVRSKLRNEGVLLYRNREWVITDKAKEYLHR
jgi:hypothetical protein